MRSTALAISVSTPLLALSVVADGVGYGSDAVYLAVVLGVAVAFSAGCAFLASGPPAAARARGAALPIVLCAAATGLLLASIEALVPPTPLRTPVVAAGCALFAGLLVLRVAGWLDDRAASVGWGIAALTVGVGARVASIESQPLGANSDMLPLVGHALGAFFSGQSPYGLHEIRLETGPPYRIPLTYLPLQWLAYAPAHRMGLDLRWTNLAIDAALGAGAVVWLYRARVRLDADASWGVALACSAYLLNGYVARRQDAEIFPFVLLLVVLARLLLRRPSAATWPIWLVVALSLATSPLAALILPFVFAHEAARGGFVRALAAALAAVALAATIVLPFAARDWHAFASGVWGHWQWLYYNDYGWARGWMRNLGFSPFAYRGRFPDALWALQLAICFALYALLLAWRRHRSPVASLAFAAWTAHLFVAWNVVAWGFLFLPASALAIVALLGRHGGDPTRAPATDRAERAGQPDAWRIPLGWTSAALSALSLAAFVHLLAQPRRFVLPIDAPRVTLRWSAEPAGPLACRRGERLTKMVRIENRSEAPIAPPVDPPGRGSVHLSYRLRNARGELVPGHSPRSAVPGVPAGGAQDARLLVLCDAPPGSYRLDVALLQEAVAWQDDVTGAVALRAELRVGSD